MASKQKHKIKRYMIFLSRSDSVLSSASSKKSSRKKSTVSLEEKEPKETKETRMRERSESTAAKTIQRNWRKHKEDKMNVSKSA